MLTEICQEIRNWFDRVRISGTFTISGGSINIPQALEGQYFRIIGSVFNDGVHKYPATDLKDETFKGAVWLLAIPTDLEALSNEIETWLADNSAVITSPYSSESFGGYSYTKASANRGDSSADGLSWQTMFGSRLNRWRKI